MNVLATVPLSDALPGHPARHLLFASLIFGIAAVAVMRLTSETTFSWRRMLLLVLSGEKDPTDEDAQAELKLDVGKKSDVPKSLKMLVGTTPFELEKRAILHKRWMMIAHTSQFPDVGTYISFQSLASLPVFVIMGSDGHVRAFHNVCRHRAHAVVRRLAGSSLRLACKYHNWQYDATGQLVKAPHFIGREGFVPSKNGLFEIHLRVDKSGFVFVNLATKLEDCFPWSDTSSSQFKHLDLKAKGVTEWDIEVDVRWRTASLLPWFVNSSRFFACCRPRISFSSYRDIISTLMRAVRRQGHPSFQYVDDGSFICAFSHGTGHLLVSALPTSSNNTTRIKCTYIPGATSVIPPSTIRALATAEIQAAVENIKSFRPADYNTLDLRQSAVRERLDKLARHLEQHKQAERLAGRRIAPAERMTGQDAVDVQAEELCRALEGLEDGEREGMEEAACFVAGGADGLEW